MISQADWALWDAIAEERRGGATYEQIMERFGVSQGVVRKACKWSGLTARVRHTNEERWAADARRCNWCGIYIEEAGPAMRRVRLGKEAWYVRVDVEPAEGLCRQCTWENVSFMKEE